MLLTFKNVLVPCVVEVKKCLSSMSKEYEKYISKLHKIEGAYLQYVRNQYARFDYKGMTTVGVIDYTM